MRLPAGHYGRKAEESLPRRLLRWIGGHELPVLVAIALIAAAIWSFAELADAVLEGEAHAFDQAVLLALRTPGDGSDPIGPLWVEETVRDFTSLGGLGVLAFVLMAVCGFLVLQRKYRTVLLIVSACISGALLSTLLKFGFDRPRPDLVAHQAYTVTPSFPSGHAMISAVAYLTLGAILARAEASFIGKAYIILVSVVLTLLVGSSRVYLGVHWPTDVLAGWSIGGAWALFCWLVARWLQRRGKVERPEEG